MPKSYRRKRTSGRRRRTRKKSRTSKKRSFGHSRGKKYGSGFPSPIQLRMRPGGFPSLQKTKLRYCTAFDMDPKSSIPGTTSQLAYIAFSTNSVVAPIVGAWNNAVWVPRPITNSTECYMHHEDYSQVYNNYRVTSSRITISASPALVDRGFGPHGKTVPCYVTLQNAHSLPGADGTAISMDQLGGMSHINSMKADGKRFIKVDPWVLNAGSDVPTSGQRARKFATTAWSSKWFKIGTNPEQTQAQVIDRPEDQQYFIITALGGSRTNPAETTDPCTVRIEVTVECSVTYWRKRQFNHIPTVGDVRTPMEPGL